MKKKKGLTILEAILYILIFATIGAIVYMLKETNMIFPKQEAQQIETISQNIEEIEKLTTLTSDEYMDEYKNSAYDYKKFNFEENYTYNIKSPVKDVIIKIPIPRSISTKQYILSLQIAPEPTRVYEIGKNKFAEFKIENPPLGETTIKLSGTIASKAYDINRAKTININNAKGEATTKYLRAEENLEVNSPLLQEVANTIQGANKEDLVKNIYYFVQDKIKYDINAADNPSAENTMRTKTGKCVNFASLMATLCRIKNIPARVISGNILKNGLAGHSWVEVYYDEYGWVLYDPTMFFITAQENKTVDKNIIRTSSNEYMLKSINSFEGWQIGYSSNQDITNEISISSEFKVEDGV